MLVAKGDNTHLFVLPALATSFLLLEIDSVFCSQGLMLCFLLSVSGPLSTATSLSFFIVFVCLHMLLDLL